MDTVWIIGGLIWIASMLLGLARKGQPPAPQKFDVKFDFDIFVTPQSGGPPKVTVHPPKKTADYTN